MSATGEYAELTRQVLAEYYQGVQERNPNLRVFSAHLHMEIENAKLIYAV